MDEYNDTLKTLQKMESRYTDGFSSLDRSFLDKLYYRLYGREISNRGCSDCYRDAYMEIRIKLKRDQAMPKISNYKLKAGAVISFFGESVAYTNANLTDEVAERYLAKNANNASMFAELPDGWKDRVNELVSLNTDENNHPVAETLPEALSLLKQRDKRISELMSELEAKDATISSLETALQNAPSAAEALDSENEVEAIRLELASANETIESDKAEIERLTAKLAELKKDSKKSGKAKN